MRYRFAGQGPFIMVANPWWAYSIETKKRAWRIRKHPGLARKGKVR